MNIYNFKINGKNEFIAARTIFDALKHYNMITDLEISDFQYSDDIELISQKKWNEYYIIDKQDNKLQTFEEYMKNVTSVVLFATR
jgi:hypothetical protein